MSQQENSVKKIDPLEFLKRPRSENKKRDVCERKIDFKEIYIGKEEAELTTQAARCLDCGNPYCEWRCPLHNYIPNWLEYVRTEKFEDAAALMHETNPLPEICGRVCPQDRLCEQACTLNTGFGAVNIGAIEKNISDRALKNNWRPDLSKRSMTDKKVAVVGAGPAGLGCAELLARNGVKPVVFDRYPEIGGLLTFGIPGFKLEKSVIRKRRKFLEDIGVEFQLNTEVGKDISEKQLKEDYDALFLGMGCYQSVTGKLPGADAQGVLKALDFLIGNVNKQESYAMDEFPFQNLRDKKVVVLGGGDTAMDCVRSAIRQNCHSVTCIYRRDQEAMPGSPSEVKNAMEEGVNFEFNQQPLRIIVESGKATGVEVARTRLVEKEGSDRMSFEVDQTDTSIIEADIVIMAFGFNPSPANWFNELGVTCDDRGLVKTTQPSTSNEVGIQQTEAEGIFAGGDMVRGADLVVTAIAEGRQAAKEILEFLEV
ncbi:glutamate synthase subunit beta [Aliikangiella sp. G2MR2-5]|uniref:glutamate synthase subunit beta n=1 Tax=Aliikangiella sp. G2MR2-5 TaxID=2788943 RepID=UPI0018AABF5C|nr:glutamate synthase subunit beta [Aliikangiella sp. G2MR2-5]